MGKYRCMGCMAEYNDTKSICPNCAYEKDSPQEEPYCLSTETVLDGRYIVGKALSVGAFGITYIAWDYKEGCKAVIKEYFPKDFASRMPGQNELNTYDGEKSRQFESGLRAFIEEYTNLTSLSQNLDGIVKTKRIFIENSTAYAVMEYIDGISLDKVIAQGKMPWQDVIQIMQPILMSLCFIHKNGLVNYNISPDNIIMTRDKKVKLLSSGSSKFATVGNNKNLNLIVKSGYSPVEMYRDDLKVGACIDVYSIAAVIYYAITGVAPQSAIERADKDELQWPSKLGVNIPLNVETAIMNALNVNSKFRTADCQKFLDELKSDKPVNRIVELKKKEDTGKISKKLKTIISIISVLVVILIAGIVLMQTDIVSFKSKTDAFPELKGYTIEQVEDILERYDIDYEIIGTLEVENAKEGTIVWQSIEPNAKITGDESMKSVQLKIAEMEIEKEDKSSEKAVMPNLIARTEASAKQALSAAGFDNYQIVKKERSDFAEGLVCDQSVEAGKKINKSENIIIYVAEHKNTTKARAATVKHTTRKPKSEKKPQATKRKQTTTSKKTTTREHTTTKKQTTTKKPTTTEAKVRVPNVKGKPVGSGQSILRNAGFFVQTVTKSTSDESKYGTIQGTSPSAGSLAKNDTIITVYVYGE